LATTTTRRTGVKKASWLALRMAVLIAAIARCLVG
jgi:hypothetical protein